MNNKQHYISDANEQLRGLLQIEERSAEWQWLISKAHRPRDVTGMIRSAVRNAMEAEKRSAMDDAI